MRWITLACVPFHDHLADREVMAAAHVTVACRSVLDLSLASRLPVPSVRAQCRTRLGAQRHQALFDQVVTKARAYGLICDWLRLKDATPVLANITVPSRCVVARTAGSRTARAKATVAAVSIDGMSWNGEVCGPECASGRGVRSTCAARAGGDGLPHGVCPGCPAGVVTGPGGAAPWSAYRHRVDVWRRRQCAGCARPAMPGETAAVEAAQCDQA